jgi:hypothetical protein
MERQSSGQFEVLKSYGLDDETALFTLASARFVSAAGGPDTQGYWLARRTAPIADPIQLRDELMLFNAEFASVTMALLADDQAHGWGTQYAGAFSYVAQSILQSTRSIDMLAGTNCYVDAMSVCRTLIGRVNLLILFALNPWLFDDWYLRASENKYRDGQVRRVLASHGLEFFGRMYAEMSEAVHVHPRLLHESGYLEPGLFAHLPAVETRVLVIAKLLVGAAASVGVASAREDFDGRPLPAKLALASRALDQTGGLLAANRVEHVTATISPERHWTWIEPNRAQVLTNPDLSALSDQLARFHRDGGEHKILGSPYGFTEEGARRQRESLRPPEGTVD